MEGRTIYCLDTSFLIDYFKGKPQATKLLNKLGNDKLFVTEISVFEIFDGIFMKKSKKEFHQFLDFLESVEIVTVNTFFALEAAEISDALRKKGKTIDDTDLFIAGMMKCFGLSNIVTKNKKHFDLIKGIEVISY